MPLDELHRRKRGKNLAVLLVLLALMAMLFGLTLVRFPLMVGG